MTIVNFLLIYFLCFFDKKCTKRKRNGGENILAGASYETIQRKWMKSGMGILYQDVFFQFNFVMYRVSISITRITFHVFYDRVKKNKVVPLHVMKAYRRIRSSA
jgi:hypothetical protein